MTTNHLSKEAQIALFGVYLPDIDDLRNHLAMVECRQALGNISPNDKYKALLGCSEKQFFFRKIVYAMYIYRTFSLINFFIEHCLPEDWDPSLNFTQKVYNIEKSEIIKAIESIIESL